MTSVRRTQRNLFVLAKFSQQAIISINTYRVNRRDKIPRRRDKWAIELGI